MPRAPRPPSRRSTRSPIPKRYGSWRRSPITSSGAAAEPTPRIAGIAIPPDAPDAPGNARTTSDGLLKLIRPGNAALSAVGVLVGALAGADMAALLARPDLVALAALTGFLGTAFGNALNDLHDHGIDRLAHPHRPLPSGHVTRMAAWNLTLLLWTGTMITGALVGTTFLLVVVVLLALLFAYERGLKARGLVGNMAVAVAAGALFPLGALGLEGSLRVPLVLGLLAAFAHLGRELLKDAEDVEADRPRRRTFAVRHGTQAATRLGALFLVSAVAVAWLPHVIGAWGDLYLAALIAPVVLFLMAAYHGIADAGRGRATAKAAMVAALAAFVIGGLT